MVVANQENALLRARAIYDEYGDETLVDFDFVYEVWEHLCSWIVDLDIQEDRWCLTWGEMREQVLAQENEVMACAVELALGFDEETPSGMEVTPERICNACLDLVSMDAFSDIMEREHNNMRAATFYLTRQRAKERCFYLEGVRLAFDSLGLI